MADNHAGRAGAHLMYGCYAVSLFTAVPMVVGVIAAYLSKGDATPIYRGHLQYGITTFWWSLLWLILGMVLLLVFIGYVFLFIGWVNMAWRSVRGWMRLIDGRPAPGY